MDVGFRVVGLADTPEVRVGLRVVGLRVEGAGVVGFDVVGGVVGFAVGLGVEGMPVVGFDVVVGRLIFSQLTSPVSESSNWLLFLKV